MRYLTADLVFDGNNFLEKGTVLVVNQTTIESILEPGSVDSSVIEHHSGCLMPGFVNAHCHLELSHLRAAVPKHTQLPGFAISLMKQRNSFSAEQVNAAIAEADAYMWQTGVVAVGDICNGNDTLPTKKTSQIYYHSFVELIALKPDLAPPVIERGEVLLQQFKQSGLSASFAAHAPYSVSSELAVLISEANAVNKQATSIHNQESQHEHDFLAGKKSGFDALYAFLNLDTSYFIPPHKNGLELMQDKLKSLPRLFVHNTFTSAADCALANNAATFWCMCPKANLYIENRLPDYNIFPKNQLCIGTDSLASNDVLNMCEEAAVLLQHSTLETATILRAMTYDGARALGIENRFGSFRIGSQPGINLVNLNERKLQFNKKIA